MTQAEITIISNDLHEIAQDTHNTESEIIHGDIHLDTFKKITICAQSSNDTHILYAGYVRDETGHYHAIALTSHDIKTITHHPTIGAKHYISVTMANNKATLTLSPKRAYRIASLQGVHSHKSDETSL